ncbi:MAG: hypothetical protein GWM90_30375, partial [Gemmatimonadetes bacterium]|nr:ester cyclase [Gemmatimonadota bacterium]NIQ59444.1 ester cyclase [Gemmatimonadota bacterium]NIU79630.1 hypothetical protein [Gammaproteobacteria bacterium]NIX48211.1 hypothetical protein [Gemmatimonadota bacterium]NIY12644.1 hypothetical protein [Gemmatimonadota bacterium]
MNRWLAAALVLGLGIPVQVAGQEEREEANKRLVRAFVQAINDRDFDALDDLVAEDLVRHSPSTPGLIVRSREDFKAFLREDVAAVPDSKQTIRMMVAEGDMVAGWNTYAGTQTGAMGPYPPSGKRVELDF